MVTGTGLVLAVMVHKDAILNSNQRLHWAPEAKRKQALRAMGWLDSRELPKFERIRFTTYVSYPDRRKRDVYNLYPTMKTYIDGLVSGGQGILPDDNDRHLSGPHMEWAGTLSGEKDVFRFEAHIEALPPLVVE